MGKVQRMPIDQLPPPSISLQELSHAGWSDVIEQIQSRASASAPKEPWQDTERVSASLRIGTDEYHFVKYMKFRDSLRSVIVNHGGPFGQANESWRYLFDSNRDCLIFPSQSSVDGDGRPYIEDELEGSRLSELSTYLYRFSKAASNGKAVWVGSSWGATVSLVTAALYPDCAKGVFCISPFLPLRSSLDFILSPLGGFLNQPHLLRAFLDPVSDVDTGSSVAVFSRYRDILRMSGSNEDVLRRFSCLFYSIMGDVGDHFPFERVAPGGLTFNRAYSFSWLASLPKPFGLDEHHFTKGLSSLKAAGAPIHVFYGFGERTIEPGDRKKLVDVLGKGNVSISPGGHSSPISKLRLRETLRRA